MLNRSVSVWEALENAGKTVVAASSGASVNIVKHKYGSEAAEVLTQSYSLGSDVFETVTNVRYAIPCSAPISLVNS